MLSPRLTAALLLMWAQLAAAAAAPVAAVLERPAPQVVRPENRVLLDLATAGPRVVGVGEHGVIVLSRDGGRTWRQSPSPVAVSLTAVAFANARRGWAVGHGGVVLRTDDGGSTWRKQLDGRQVIGLIEQDAGADPGRRANAAQFKADGPDKPWLALSVVDERSLMVVGAYGMALRSDDGGETWHSLMRHIDNPRGLHLYAAAHARSGLWLAGEQGFLARSLDGGRTFTSMSAPYQGSYFALAPLPSGEIVLGGLKGNAFRSVQNGAGFERITGLPPISLSAVRADADGRVLFANQAGLLMISLDGARSALPLPQAQPLGPVAALLPVSSRFSLAAGVRGVTSFNLPAAPTP